MMALVRLFSSQGSLIKTSLFRHVEIPCVSSVAWKQSVAKQLGLPEPPKRPLAPYVSFLQHFLQNNKSRFPQLTHSEVFKKATQEWRDLNLHEKNQWTDSFEQEKVRYAARYKDYVQRLTPKEVESMKHLKKQRLQNKAKRQVTKERKQECENLGRPKYPGNSFILYTMTLDRGDAISKEFVIGAAKSWHKLPSSTQDVYKEKARLKLAQYKKELVVWEERMMREGRPDLVRTSQGKKGTGGETKTHK